MSRKSSKKDPAAEAERIIAGNRRAYEGVIELLDHLTETGALLGRTRGWMAFDAKLVDRAMLEAMQDCDLRTHPDASFKGRTPVFGRGDGDDDHVFVTIVPIDSEAASYPFMTEIYTRIEAIPLLAGERLDMLTTKVETMRARSREYVEEIIAAVLRGDDEPDPDSGPTKH